jgi:hypothetical protein
LRKNPAALIHETQRGEAFILEVIPGQACGFRMLETVKTPDVKPIGIALNFPSI